MLRDSIEEFELLLFEIWTRMTRKGKCPQQAVARDQRIARIGLKSEPSEQIRLLVDQILDVIGHDRLAAKRDTSRDRLAKLQLHDLFDLALRYPCASLQPQHVRLLIHLKMEERIHPKVLGDLRKELAGHGVRIARRKQLRQGLR